jgi:peptidoglycan/LPS O-acetylase OafA/YrhL
MTQKSADALSRRLPSLDGIRAVCILLVIGAHVQRTVGFPAALEGINPWLFNGALGVNIFFVLSGFIITYLLAKEKQLTGGVSLKKFYIRRILRIVPVYYLFILVFALLDRFTLVDSDVCGYLTSLTFTKNFGCAQWLDGHLWSLSVEEQFYILWPPIALLLPKNRKLYFALGLVCLAPAFRLYAYFTGDMHLLQYSFFTHMDSLMIGCITGFAYQRRYPTLMRLLSYRKGLLRLVAASLIYLVWIAKHKFILSWLALPLGETIQGLGSVFLIVSYAHESRGPVFRLLNTRLMILLGTLSYSIYIWQQLFMVGHGFYGDRHPVFLAYPFNVLGCIMAGWLSYFVFEKPFLKLRARYK